MGLIPAPPWEPGQVLPDELHYARKYSAQDVMLVSEEVQRGGGSGGFEVLLEEWGTSGRRRPTVGDLVNLLLRAENQRAAHYLTSEVLGVTSESNAYDEDLARSLDGALQLVRGSSLENEECCAVAS